MDSKSTEKKSILFTGEKISGISMGLSKKVLLAYTGGIILGIIVVGIGLYVHNKQIEAFENQKEAFREIVKIQEKYIPVEIIKDKISPKLKEIKKNSDLVDLYGNLVRAILIVLLFGIVGATIIGKFFTDVVMVRPIMHIAKISEKIAEGDLEQEVKVKSRDEIGLLAQTFNYMTQNLKEIINYQKEQINKLLEAVNIAAKGDLRKQITIDSDDEFGQLSSAFNTMVKNLSKLVSKIEEANSKINVLACNILAATEEQASGVTEQASQISQIASSLQELTASAKQIAKNTQQVAEIAQTANNTAFSGERTVDETISAIKKIEQTVQATARKIRELGESSRKIGKVITAISDIAEQTNLLALNAAIEAARAGEQGRGFAVVADEIRKLAERSSASAGDINNLITTIQSETNSTVMAMEEGQKSVEEGVKLINRTGNAFKEITRLVEYTANISKEISLSTEQQTKGNEQLSFAMTNLSQVVKQTEVSARQNAQAAHELNELARYLKQSISEIVIK